MKHDFSLLAPKHLCSCWKQVRSLVHILIIIIFFWCKTEPSLSKELMLATVFLHHSSPLKWHQSFIWTCFHLVKTTQIGHTPWLLSTPNRGTVSSCTWLLQHTRSWHLAQHVNRTSMIIITHFLGILSTLGCRVSSIEQWVLQCPLSPNPSALSQHKGVRNSGVQWNIGIQNSIKAQF